MNSKSETNFTVTYNTSFNVQFSGSGSTTANFKVSNSFQASDLASNQPASEIKVNNSFNFSSNVEGRGGPFEIKQGPSDLPSERQPSELLRKSDHSEGGETAYTSIDDETGLPEV